ncbi:MAG: DUF177 domain-containing protein [Prevotellaceae bacterium]|nr:DUF177 domain-containing protein [Prevotellaceae bacterium]
MNIVLEFSGKITVPCDRCLEELEVRIKGKNFLSARFGEEPESDENEENLEDIIYLNPEDEEIDLTNYVYESVCLALPIQRVHANDKNGASLCNPEMLKYISNSKDNKTGTGENETISPFGILKNINI